MFTDYQEDTKEIFRKELENVKLNFNILKDFYYDELNYAKGIIQELSMVIDDIALK